MTIQKEITKINVKDGCIESIETSVGAIYKVKSVIVSTGTYLKGKIFIGEFSQESGPDGVFAANKLSECLKDLGVKINYVIEDELPRVLALAARQHAVLYYIVLTADAEEIERRIRNRGDIDLIDRALFLKRKLDAMPENKGYLYNNTGKTTDEAIAEIVPDRFIIGDNIISVSEKNQKKKTGQP